MCSRPLGLNADFAQHMYTYSIEVYLNIYLHIVLGIKKKFIEYFFFFLLCLVITLILTQTLMVKKEVSGPSTISSTTRR